MPDRIDAWTHIFPKAYFEKLQTMASVTGPLKRWLKLTSLYDLDHRFRLMDGFEGYRQLLTPSMPAIEDLADGALAVELMRLMNDGLAELVARHPHRFPAFAANSPEQASPPAQQVMIPGPLRSFLRMAGISQKVPPEDVLPELARNVYTQGYSRGRETEFLLLLEHYVHQARELQALASSNNGEIRVAHCADAGPLLQILGYRLRYGCGQKDAALVTLNPDSAFLSRGVVSRCG